MRAYTRILSLLLAAGVFLGGLSCGAKKYPEPKTPPPSRAQRKEAEANQWLQLAQDVAKQVQGAVMQRNDLDYVPIYVRPGMDSAFSQAFTPMLQSALVRYGLEVSVQQEDALVLTYNVQDSVVLNAALRYNNRYIMHTSRVAYLGDQGLGQYAKDAVWNRYAKRRPVYAP